MPLETGHMKHDQYVNGIRGAIATARGAIVRGALRFRKALRVATAGI